MTRDAHEDARYLAEHFQEKVYEPSSGVNLSTGYATLKIDMTLMTETERAKVYEAERLLSEAGITFDVNSGGGSRNWEIDWSLSGATVETRSLRCSKPACPNDAGSPLWAIYFVRAGRVLSYAYCSTECREEDITRVNQDLGWQCLLRV